jgi:uncharacterized protein YndB with AHSA1/START domain
MERDCAVRFTRYYRAAPGEVWAALTEPDSLARWLGPMADSMRQSTRSLEPERLLEVDWTPRGESPSVVRFELRPDGTGTVLVLDHRRIDARVGMRAMGIWERHLERLDALLGDSGTP